MARTIRGPTAGAGGEKSGAGPSLGDTIVDPPRRSEPAPAAPEHPSMDRFSAEESLTGVVLGGKYEVLRPLAVGGMGTVYEARHTALARRFAVKVLSLESGKQADAVPRFKREAELASSIGHENIIDVVDFDRTADGRWYIVMELLEGEELRERMFRLERLPLDEVVAIAKQLGAALDAAHSRGVVHRDLKPENIFVLNREDRGVSIKVLDFGISKVRDADQGLTRPGEVLGTPYYMAPEQARGDRTIDHRADLFAFGAVVYEALTGVAPFEGATPNVVLRSILLDEPQPPDEIVPDLPAAVSKVVLKALSKEPQDRYQTGGQLGEALAAAARDRGDTTEPTRASAPEPTASREPEAPARKDGPAASRRYGPAHLAIAFALGAAAATAALLLARML